ncbi:DnaJ subfamily B member 9 [Elsinoe australis]|uniref:DnaJ subfamily B member 9 n=1 Tax=Elsinoe australis TaxID=40998 RepID=A0A2P7YEE9_9PEZI|nr:DnaJ subfamily B member 9 [Elsinoe australis]
MLRDDPPSHYDTLGLKQNATAKEIKKQFYTLSKSHHPDLHPNDPNASSRFVKISEAYTVLGSPEKRAKYDRSIVPASAPASRSHPSGSYSSHTAGPAGGRAPSGLSRRRTQFRGPPPSFYKSGGWGSQGAKRAEYQGREREHGAAGAGTGGRTDAGSAGTDGKGSWAYDEPGTGPGGFAPGWDNDVPHFDRQGHYRTQESVERMRRRARNEEVEVGASGGVLGPFIAVTGVIGFVFAISAFFAPPTVSKREDCRRREGGGATT